MKSPVRRIFFLLSGLIIASIILFILVNYEKSSNNVETILGEFNNNLEIQDNYFNELIEEYEKVLLIDSDDYWPLLEELQEGNDYFVFVYDDSDLLFWNTSLVFFDDFPRTKSSFLIENGNNWYFGKSKLVGKYELLLVRSVILDYKVDNQYINKSYSKYFTNYSGLSINRKHTESSYPINFFDSNDYFLEINHEKKLKGNFSYELFVLLITYLLLCILVFEFVKSQVNNNRHRFSYYLISFFALIIIRLLDIYFQFSVEWSNSNLFDFYVSEYDLFSSLGEVFITLILFLVFTVFLHINKIVDFLVNEQTNNRIIAALSYVLLVLLPLTVISILNQLIIIVGFFEWYSFFNNTVAFFVFFEILFLGVVLYFSLRILSTYIIRIKFSYLALVFGSVSGLLFQFQFQEINYVIILTSFFLIIFSLIFSKLAKGGNKFYFLFHLTYLVVLSLIFSLVINYANNSNRNIKQQSIASFLSQSGDKEIEENWINLLNHLQDDKYLNTDYDVTSFNVDDELIDYLIVNYFESIDQGIDFQITVCNKGDMLRIENERLIIGCSEFFENMKTSALDSIGNNLFLISNEPDNIYYLSEYKLSEEVIIFFEFYSFYVPTGLGYAELLVDLKENTPDLSDFSFANYHDNILISKFGEFEYHTTGSIFDAYQDSICFQMNDFIHYKTTNGDGDVLIVSRPMERFSSQMISFSILFLFFSIFFIFLAIIIYGSNVRQIFNLNLRLRLQMFFMIALSFIIFSTAVIILYYTEKNNSVVLQDELNEKAHSVLIELQHKLKDHTSLKDVEKEELEKLLKKFSLVFFSDINIYDTEGRIIASSRPQIFENGFLSVMVNPRAFEEIFVDNLLYYNCTEKIGNLEYFSSYLPLMLTASQPAGIINLPYFARQKEQKRSFHFLLFTFINLFVILGILGTIIAIFYSRILTKPLTELQQNIANIRIDMQNAKIEWDSDDEIGQLISEYNKMVDKLEASADILKRSEREIAWREVARQIAHEIKNPLTPMKLNIQYLEKSYKESDIEFGDKLKDISSTLIEQIDTLNKVAEMFSDMAKSNIRKFTNIDLLAVINSTVKLFDNSNNIAFEVVFDDADNEFVTKGIKKDITQIFNNLLKNSVEAIGGKKDGQITINIKHEGSFHSVEVIDNGNGIPANLKDMIFTPYFTTRSTGTGLGLAIVKTIITDLGGNISIKSTNKKGTTFALKFLKTI